MKMMIGAIIGIFNKIWQWLKQKDRFMNQRSVTILYVTLLVAITIICLFDNIKVTKVIVNLVILLLLGMFLLGAFDISDEVVKRLTRGTCNTLRELFKRISLASYFYGLFCFSFETSIFFEMIIYLFTEMIWNMPRIVSFFDLWIGSMFVYTFFYFTYHIYFAESCEKIEEVKQWIQLYAAIGATVSFIMLLFGENREIKVFIVGTMLEYTWLQYLSTRELTKRKNG